jgi:trans-aconitate 2-methyltransferase
MTTERVPAAQAWDAGLYDDKHSFVWKRAANLLTLLAPRPGERILDLGCGTGHLTAQIAAAGAEVLGLDSAPAMIEQARQAYPALRFELGDARDFHLAELVDAVFSNAALHWVVEPERVITCVRQALKPGGRFVAEFGGRGNVRALAAALDRMTLACTGMVLGNPWYFPSVAEYALLLERGGLEVSYAELFDRPTPLEGPEGLRHWVAMFCGHWLSRIPLAQRDEFFRCLEDDLRSVLYDSGSWLADYRRLRVAARRPEL